MELTVEKIREFILQTGGVATAHEVGQFHPVDVIAFMLAELDKRTPSPSADKLIAAAIAWRESAGLDDSPLVIAITAYQKEQEL